MIEGGFGIDDIAPSVAYKIDNHGEVAFLIGDMFSRGGVMVNRTGALAMIAELQRVITETDRMLRMRDEPVEKTTA